MKLLRFVLSAMSVRFAPGVGMALACLWFLAGQVSAAQTAQLVPSVSATIPVGVYANGIAVNSAGTTAYVANQIDGTVSVINMATNSVTATVPVGSNPVAVAVNPAGTFAYAVNFTDYTVSVIDTATNVVTTTIPVVILPNAVTVNPAGTIAYVTGAGGISEIDTATNTVTATVYPNASPFGIAVNAAGTYAYLADGAGSMLVMDTATNSVVASVPVGQQPIAVALNPAGTYAYVPNFRDETVSVIDTTTNSVIATVPVGWRSYSVAVNPAGTYAYVTNEDGTLSVINTVTNSVTATVTLGDMPQGIAINPAGTFAYVANLFSPVSVIALQGVNFGAAAVGSSSSVKTMTFSFPGGAVLSNIAALTGGAPNQDFTISAANPGTCVPGTYDPGSTCTVKVQFTPRYSGVRNGAVVLSSGMGSAAAVIGTGYLSGVGQGPQIGFTPPTQTSLATGLTFLSPEALAVDGQGDVFVTDTGYQAVVKIAASGGTVSAASSAIVLPGGSQPVAVAVDGSGNVFVADDGGGNAGGSIYEYQATGGAVTASSPVVSLGSFTINAPAGQQINCNAGPGQNLNTSCSYPPSGIAVDASGNVFVSAGGSPWLLEFPASGGYATMEAIPLSAPEQSVLAVDGSGNIFLAGWFTGTVSEIPAAGGYTTTNLLASGLGSISDMAIDGNGNLFVTQVNFGGPTTTVIELPASGGYANTSVFRSASGLFFGIAVDGRGNFYLSNPDRQNVFEWDYADAPPLNFPSATYVGATDAQDNPQSIQIENIGNEELIFPPSSSATSAVNTTIGPDYALDSQTSCAMPGIGSSSAALPVGGTCGVAVDFAPTASGALDESLLLAYNSDTVPLATNLSANIPLTGTGTPPISIAITPATLSPIAEGIGTEQFAATGTYGGGTTENITSMVSWNSTNTSVAAFGSGGLATTGSSTGTTQISANLGSVTSNAVALTVYQPVPASLSIYDPNHNSATQSAYLYQAFSQSLTVALADQYGNPLGGQTVTLNAPSTEASAALSASSCITSTTVPVGYCRVTATANNTPGGYAVTATIGSLTASFSLTNIPTPNLVVTTNQDDAGANANCTIQKAPGAGTDGSCSLRDALLEAANLGAANITFDAAKFGSAQTIVLTNGSLILPSYTSIIGPTSDSRATPTNLVTVSGNNSYRIFSVATGVTSAAISNLTMTRGMVNGGGAIDNAGSLTVSECTFSNNTVPYGYTGGAIENTGQLTLNGSTFANNNAVVAGGAIYSTSTLKVNDSTFTGNTGGQGGAIYNYGSVTMTNSTISGNTGSGAAIFNNGVAMGGNSILSGDTGGECAGLGCFNNTNTNRAYFLVSGAEQQIGGVWDSGTITLGWSDRQGSQYSYTVNYGQYSTPASIASTFGGGISNNDMPAASAEGFGSFFVISIYNGASFGPFAITNPSKSFTLTQVYQSLLSSREPLKIALILMPFE